jgi:hypothetical protein
MSVILLGSSKVVGAGAGHPKRRGLARKARISSAFEARGRIVQARFKGVFDRPFPPR